MVEELSNLYLVFDEDIDVPHQLLSENFQYIGVQEGERMNLDLDDFKEVFRIPVTTVTKFKNFLRSWLKNKNVLTVTNGYLIMVQGWKWSNN